jgi:hypothetical protein
LKERKQLQIVPFFGSKIAVYLSLGLHKVCSGYRRSLFSPQKGIPVSSISKDEIY